MTTRSKRRTADGSGRRAFALPPSTQHYAPDRRAQTDHIKLELSFDFERKILYGRCTTTVTAVGGPLSSLELQAGRMRILSARVGAKRVAFDLVGDQLRIELPRLAAGKSATVVVDYEVHQPEQGIYFIGPDKGYPKRPLQVWTQGQDADAHYWFPCVDHPNAKATSEVIAVVPAGFFVLSNGALVSTETDKARKTTTYHWKMDIPHVTYLISVVAGKFVGRTTMADGVPVSWYVEPGREAEGLRSFGKTPKMLRFFNERIGYKYPYAKYAEIAVREFIFGGMENTSCTTQTDATLHDARAHKDYSSEPLVAHELAHQWFGDLLTCKDWAHAWLNEGFATYFELLWKEHEHGEDEFAYAPSSIRIPISARTASTIGVRSSQACTSSRPICSTATSTRRAAPCCTCCALSWATSCGGAPSTQYVTEHAQGSVETVDFARAVEKASGRQLRALLRPVGVRRRPP